MVLVSCVVLALVHAARQSVSPATDDAIVSNLAFIPARLSLALGIARDALQANAREVPEDTLRLVLGGGGARPWTLLTYALLHGSWSHLLFNCVWLASFGSPVARRCGVWRFLALMAVAAIVGALAQFAATPGSFVPVVGASGAIAGAMGAAVRFVFRPASEVSDPDVAALPPFARPALGARQILANSSAIGFVVMWFLTNLIFGLFPGLVGMNDGPIAWQAHIGGFLVGLLAFDLVDRRRTPATSALEAEDSANMPLE